MNNSALCLFVSLQPLYTASVSEDIPVDGAVLQVGATDADVGVSAWIQFTLSGPNAQDFTMDPDTGTSAAGPPHYHPD